MTKHFVFQLFILITALASHAQKSPSHTVPCTTKMSDYLIKNVDTSKARGLADNYFLWNNGSIIKVKFMRSGSIQLRNMVIRYAKEWEQFANVHFEFVSDTSSTSNIRIRLGEGEGHNSYIGTDCNRIPKNYATLNLDTSDLLEDERWMRSVVLHEFGHALGLLHEQSYPDAIRWNKDTVYKYFAKSQVPPWSTEDVDNNIFYTYDQFYTNGTKYDPKSIMHYWVEPWETLDGSQVETNYDLSIGDKKLIAALYPKNLLKSSLEVPRINVSNLRIEVVQNSKKKGLSIYPNFDIESNSLLGQIYLVAKLTDEEGYYFKDDNTRFNWGGYVATYTKLILLPDSKMTFNKNLNTIELFLPYSEIPVRKGKKICIEFSVVLNDTKNGQLDKLMYYAYMTPFKLKK